MTQTKENFFIMYIITMVGNLEPFNWRLQTKNSISQTVYFYQSVPSTGLKRKDISRPSPIPLGGYTLLKGIYIFVRCLFSCTIKKTSYKTCIYSKCKGSKPLIQFEKTKYQKPHTYTQIFSHENEQSVAWFPPDKLLNPAGLEGIITVYH